MSQFSDLSSEDKLALPEDLRLFLVSEGLYDLVMNPQDGHEEAK